jgi:hypothetical protein
MLFHSSQPSLTLVGTDHGHFAIAGRQDVKHAVILTLAPMLTCFFSSKLIDRRRFRETTTELASLYGSRHGADLWMLRETHGLEEAGLSVQNLPFLTESIRIVNDRFSVTRNHVAHGEIAHEADTVTKMLALALLNQDGNKVLIGLELDALATTQMHFKDMLLVGGLRVQELKSRELDRQGSASNTVKVVDSLALDFENIRANTERSTGNVRHVMADLRTDVDVQGQARLKSRSVEQNEITFTMEVKMVSLPRLEMRITFAAPASDWRSTDTREAKNESVRRSIGVTGTPRARGKPKRVDLMARKRVGGRNV